MERLTVSLDDYIQYILKKWKIAAVFVVMFVLLFVLSADRLGEKIVIPPSEEYLELKEQETSIGAYIESAPLMEIDSTCVQEIIVYLSDISERKVLKNHVDSGAIWQDFGDENAPYYFPDIVTWMDGKDERTAEIRIQHYEEEKCVSMAEYMVEKLQTYDEKVEIYAGTPHVSSDKTIAEVQSWYKNRRNAIEGQLEHAAAGYTIETSWPVAAIAGVLTGGLTAMVVLFISFVLRKTS